MDGRGVEEEGGVVEWLRAFGLEAVFSLGVGRFEVERWSWSVVHIHHVFYCVLLLSEWEASCEVKEVVVVED